MSREAPLARAFHADGFVALDRETFGLTDAQLTRVAAAVRARYEQFFEVANRHAIDLALPANAERIPGFYVRQGGRIDMELVSVVAKTNANLPDARATTKSLVREVEPVDTELLRGLEERWQRVVQAIFQTDHGSDLRSEYALEYIGCVVARPGDGDQNWHLDGVHRNLTKHEPADRLNVFVPLVEITPEIGGTEMKRASQFHNDGQRGAAFEDYAELESVTHYVAAGTPVVMDYRVWHRGRANRSPRVLRPLLYFKYARDDSVLASAKRSATTDTSKNPTKTKKKRIALVSVSSEDKS